MGIVLGIGWIVSRFFPVLGLITIESASLWLGPLGNGRIAESLEETGGFLLMLVLLPLWYISVRAAVQHLGPAVVYLATVLPFGFMDLYFANEFSFCVTCGGGHCGYAAIIYIVTVGVLVPAAVLVASLGFSSPHPITVLIPYVIFFLPWWLPAGIAGETAVVFLVVAAVMALDGVLAAWRALTQPPANSTPGSRRGLVAIAAGMISTFFALVLLFVPSCSSWWIYPENLLFLGPTLTAAGLGLCRIRKAQSM